MTLLEIEHKFHFTAPLLARFLSNSGYPPFKRLEALSYHNRHRQHDPLTQHAQQPRVFEDIYYDTHTHSLARAGLWLRKRDNVWGAKMRRAIAGAKGKGKNEGEGEGQFTRTTFEETRDLGRISDLVSGTLVASGEGQRYGGDAAGAFGLVEAARIITTRRAFRADGRFNVVFDRCEFVAPAGAVRVGMVDEAEAERGEHHVGEVELEIEVLDKGGKEERSADKAHVEIAEFMDRYAWLFRAAGPGVGKLSAYFEWVRGKSGRKMETR
jgi:thiamine-triphosphatase